MGEEVGHYNGAYKVSQGLLERFGERRVVDTPIAETGFAGVGIGAAMVGLRPIIEFMTLNFSLVAHRPDRQQRGEDPPHVGRAVHAARSCSAARAARRTQLGAQHWQALESLYAHVPGLKVVMPSTPARRQGPAQDRDPRRQPGRFIEGETLYALKGEVPDGRAPDPARRGRRQAPGHATSRSSRGRRWCRPSLEAADELAGEGIEAEVVDPRTLRPLDDELLVESVRRRNRCVIVEEGWPFAGVGAEIVALGRAHCFDDLDAPVERVTSLDVPMPYAKNLEDVVLPSRRIAASSPRARRQDAPPTASAGRSEDRGVDGDRSSIAEALRHDGGGQDPASGPRRRATRSPRRPVAEVETDKANMDFEASTRACCRGARRGRARRAGRRGDRDPRQRRRGRSQRRRSDGEGARRRAKAPAPKRGRARGRAAPEAAPRSRSEPPAHAGRASPRRSGRARGRAPRRQRRPQRTASASARRRWRAGSRPSSASTCAASRARGPGGRIVERDVTRGAAGGTPAKPDARGAATSRRRARRRGAPPAPRPDAAPSSSQHAADDRDAAGRGQARRSRTSTSAADVDMDEPCAFREQLVALVGDGDKSRSTTWSSRRARWRCAACPSERVVRRRRRSSCTTRVDVGIAVAIDDGLLTPGRPRRRQEGARPTIARAGARARRARARGQARRRDLSGATFTVSNLGMLPASATSRRSSTRPKAAILAVGAVREVPVVNDGQVVPGRR